MRARLAAALRRAATRLDPSREYAVNTVRVTVDEDAIRRALLRIKRRDGHLGLD